MDYTMRMDFMCEEKCCTQILIDFRHEKVEIKNTTDKIMLRAFGININPTWEDFLEFLEERCFPRTRDNLKLILQDLNLDFYDPWNIVEKTQGHMGEDMKWLQDGYWYKADQFGYESLAEVVASHLLGQSSIKEAAVYEPVVILYKGKEYRGCRSKNFRYEEELLVSLERLFRNHTTVGLARQLSRISDIKEKIRYTEETVRKITKIEDFGIYLTKMFEMDAFFFNEDRHTNNISILYNKETDRYRLCPFYDMGLSLFADTKVDFPLGNDYFVCKEKIIAKPFHRNFDEQLDAANVLYGSYLKFDFSASRVVDVLMELREKYLLNDTDISRGRIDGFSLHEFQRVEETLRYQAAKYKYMFQS